MTEDTTEHHVHSEADTACISCGLDFDFDLPNSLIDTAHLGRLVIFAGAGVSTEVPAVFPGTFYDTIRSQVDADEGVAFPELMQQYERKYGRQQLLCNLKQRFDYADSFDTLRRLARRFHRELATMPYLRDVVTTNWDSYFEEECLGTPFVSGEDFAFHDMPGRRVYKIHGSMSTLSTLIITEDDYARRLDELRENALGGTLRHILATTTVVFTGYSLRDWNFRRLYTALRADMGQLAPRAYFVSPFPSSQAQELGLTWIRTSGVKFLKELKAALVRESHFKPDDVYDVVADFEAQVLEAKEVVDTYSHKDYPAIAHCWSYQEGLLDACGRIALRRGSGEYSNTDHVARLIRRYEDMVDKAIDSGKYFHGAYLDGYVTALYLLLAHDDAEMLDSVPLYSVYGADSSMRSEEEFREALLHSRRRAPKARAEARKITRDLPADMVMTHGPFLGEPDYEEHGDGSLPNA